MTQLFNHVYTYNWCKRSWCMAVANIWYKLSRCWIGSICTLMCPEFPLQFKTLYGVHKSCFFLNHVCKFTMIDYRVREQMVNPAHACWGLLDIQTSLASQNIHHFRRGTVFTTVCLFVFFLFVSSTTQKVMGEFSRILKDRDKKRVNKSSKHVLDILSYLEIVLHSSNEKSESEIRK